jgi:hypothetical protein
MHAIKENTHYSPSTPNYQTVRHTGKAQHLHLTVQNFDAQYLR